MTDSNSGSDNDSHTEQGTDIGSNGIERSRDEKEVRDEYLMRMYDQLWQSMSRVEGGMWSFITAYAAIAVSVTLGIKGDIPIFFATLFSTIISFWGINIAIESFKWQKHNLVQVSNIEEELLLEEDINNIIPEEYISWDDPTIERFSISGVNLGAFAVALVVSVSAYLVSASVSFLNFMTLYLMVLIGILYSLRHYIKSYRWVRDLIRNTKDSEVSKKPNYFYTIAYSVTVPLALSMLLLTIKGPTNIVISACNYFVLFSVGISLLVSLIVFLFSKLI